MTVFMFNDDAKLILLEIIIVLTETAIIRIHIQEEASRKSDPSKFFKY